MVEPAYQELLKSDIPHVSKDGVHVAVIAGQSYGASVSSVIVLHKVYIAAIQVIDNRSPGPSFSHGERRL